MTKATRVGFKLDRLLERSPTVSRCTSSEPREPTYLGGAQYPTQ